SEQTSRQTSGGRTSWRRSIGTTRRSSFGTWRLAASLLCQGRHAPDELLLRERVAAGPLQNGSHALSLFWNFVLRELAVAVGIGAVEEGFELPAINGHRRL